MPGTGAGPSVEEPPAARAFVAEPRSGGGLGAALSGLFSGGGEPVIEASLSPGDVAPPYGTIARVCGLPRADFGTAVDTGAKGFTLYDTAPGSLSPRSFTLTGFADGCPRRFTASNAVFGAPLMHEQIRYGLAASQHGFSATDAAYERIKARICGAPEGRPCGPRMDRLAKQTVFLTIYERFSGNSRWSNILLHDRRIVAQDFEGG